MLNQNSFASQSTIALLLPFRQWMIFGFLERCLAIFMKICQSLITSVSQNAKMVGKLAAFFFEQLKVVLASMRKGCGNDLSGLLVCNYLCFLSVTLLFAAIVLLLAFFGRSIACSLVSTSTTSKTVLLGASVFLPGKTNFPEQTNASSTFRIVRHTAASLIP